MAFHQVFHGTVLQRRGPLILSSNTPLRRLPKRTGRRNAPQVWRCSGRATRHWRLNYGPYCTQWPHFKAGDAAVNYGTDLSFSEWGKSVPEFPAGTSKLVYTTSTRQQKCPVSVMQANMVLNVHTEAVCRTNWAFLLSRGRCVNQFGCSHWKFGHWLSGTWLSKCRTIKSRWY